MRVAVVGAGFTGLACAVELSEKGVAVEVYERENYVGGLAAGFQEKSWNWSLEHFYHHIFTNDLEIIEISKKVGLPPKVYSPTTNSLINGKVLRLDSPLSVLRFSELSVWSRLRMGFGLAVLKIIPNGLFLEKYRAEKVLPVLIGKEAYEKVWGKLLKAKFGSLKSEVNMAWFWSRVSKRTKNLGYFDGGFGALANKMKEYVEEKGGKVLTGRMFDFEDKNIKRYDRVVVTTPAPIADKVTGKKQMPKIKYLWAQTLVLELNKSLMSGYWLNVLERDWPFLVVVEHTKLVNKKYFSGSNIVYLGNYLEEGSPQLKMEKEELFKMYSKYIKRINNSFEKKWVVRSRLFRAPFAQPVFPVNYSKELDKIKAVDGKFVFANMSMVYPFDRGTNYAVKLGLEAAKKCLA